METRINDYERGTLVPLICEMLLKCGSTPLPSKVICDGIRKHGHIATTRSVRRVINHIRREGLIHCVASSRNGFFVASNVNEISECIGTLESLNEAIQEVIYALREQRYIKFNQ